LDGVIAANRSGEIIIFNESAAQVFGYTEEEALEGLNIRDIYPDGLAYEVMKKMRAGGHGGPGKLKSFEVDVLSKRGERIPISLSAAIVYEEGKEVATIGFFHDLRENLRIREELERTQMQLLQAEKMASLGKLAAGVAHQINNPLGGITLYAKLIMEENELDDAVTEDLQRILKDAERCRDTVKELLEFTRQTRHLVREHDINAALSRTVFLLENQSLFHNIQIRKDLEPSLAAVPVDIQQLNHVFMNVILNAAQAMDGRGVLTLRSRTSARGDRIVIEIADTGPGIPKEVMPHIFDPFYTTKEEGKGTGLGLSLAYGIMENHGGSIRAVSDSGDGTTFIIELPIKGIDHEGSENAGRA
jgi:PAS domain S-box-containing protein